jgi:hypothetical protein
MMYSALEKYLLSAPVPGLELPALIEPTEQDLFAREVTLGWHRDEGVGALLFTLRVNGVLILFCNEILEVIGARNVHHQ